MRIYYMSDLHLEHGSRLPPLPYDVPPGSVCVLAGDIINARCLDPSKTDAGSRKQREALWKFAGDLASRFDHILYVPGNHEYYGTSIQEAERVIAAYLPESITYLQNAKLVIGSTLFVGATLWTGMDNPVRELSVSQGMNDFQGAIFWEPVSDVKPRLFRTADARLLHQVSVAYIKSAAQDWPGDAVVITHHCPDVRCADPRFAADNLTDGYVTDLSGVFYDCPNITHWFCGHTHQRGEFKVSHDQRILMNCRGYEMIERDRAKSFDIGKFVFTDFRRTASCEWIDAYGELKHRLEGLEK